MHHDLLDALRRNSETELIAFSGGDPIPGRSFAKLAKKFEVVAHRIEAITINDTEAIAVVQIVLRPRKLPEHAYSVKEEILRLTIEFQHSDNDWILASEAKWQE